MVENFLGIEKKVWFFEIFINQQRRWQRKTKNQRIIKIQIRENFDFLKGFHVDFTIIKVIWTAVLRHNGPKLGLTIGTDGFAKLSEVLSLSTFKKGNYTQEEVLDVVKENDKQRFSVCTRNGATYIRANQGHSISVRKKK